ncbi:type-2 histone deacetylase 1-like [Trichoplusia ni]|uniref:Type-2 histone deacetylase 1-like n=1 Tax=Trichoplusia ni TaxID=7111 RepID=A0A7E5W9A6_TRINI|nr:type-2 histone deacetylase 1-like [Trichoplusia ni]
MAASIRIFLALVGAVVINGENAFDDPFFKTKPFPLSRKSENSPHEHNVEKFTEQHSSNAFSFNNNGNNPYDAFHSYLQGGLDPYFAWPSMGNMGLPKPFNPMNFGMPGFNNIFNIPGPNGNPTNQPNNNNGGEVGKKPTGPVTAPEKDPKALENMPPKTNLDNDDAGKGGKDVEIDKKKDYLLMGSGGNGNNNMYLLHENMPNGNPVVQPTQPGNVIYVPYQPGQGSQLYQVVATPNNVPLAPEKQFVNPFSSVVSNLPSANNPLNQNNGYILVYFNGQMIQIPGVILNPPQNYLQNPVQGNNVPVVQNPPTNNMYTTMPNQGTNNMYIAQPNTGANNVYIAQPNPGTNPQYVVQMPGSNTAQPINVPSSQGNPQPAYQPNGPNNGYYQPTMQGNQGNFQNQPGNQYQHMSAPTNSGSNGYGQPNILNQGSNQGAGSQNPTITYPAVVLPMDRNGNQGSPMVNTPKHDTAMTPTNIQPTPQPPAPNNSLDRDTLSNYGAIPAVMIAGYKENKKDSPAKVEREADKPENKEEVKIRPT